MPTSPVVSPTAPASTPLVPSTASATGTPAPSSSPVYNAGSMNAATGAGAGLAAVFGAAALLL